MSVAEHARRILFASGLMAITLSVALDGHFATDGDPSTTVPAPASLALLAIGGVAGVGAALIRRRRK